MIIEFRFSPFLVRFLLKMTISMAHEKRFLFETLYVNLIRLFYQLGARNNFNVASPYEPGETPWLTQDQQIATINSVKDQPPPSVYIRHQYFIDFNEFGEESPIYMNVIRDPIARFSSFYHFIRFGNKEGPV